MISYQPLFETMKRKQITSYALFQQGFSKATYYSIQKGNSVSTNTIEQLCKLLKCSVSEVMEYIDTDQALICLFFRTYSISEYIAIIEI